MLLPAISSHAQSFTSEILRVLSFHTPVLYLFDRHPSNFNSEIRDGFITVQEFYWQPVQSRTVAQQAFSFSERGSGLAQVWIVAGAERRSQASGTVLEPLTILICSFDTVKIMRDFPTPQDTTSYCELANTSEHFLANELSGKRVESEVQLSTTEYSRFSSASYTIDARNRWIQLSRDDAVELTSSIRDRSQVAIQVDVARRASNRAEANFSYSLETPLPVDWFFVRELEDNEGVTPTELQPFDPHFLSTDWNGPSIDRVRQELNPTYELLMTAFNRTYIPEQLQLLRGGNWPRVELHYVNGNAVQRIRLATHRYFFQQYTYQFAHELGHVLTNWEDTPSRDYKWFEETLAELASAYVIRKFSQSAPNASFTASSWDAYFDLIYDEYDKDLQSNYGIASTDKLTTWFAEHEPAMRASSVIRALNWGVAREMFSFFLTDTSAWEAAGYINRWDVSQNATIYAYLESWRQVLKANEVSDAVIDHMLSILPPERASSKPPKLVHDVAGLPLNPVIDEMDLSTTRGAQPEQ